MSTIFADKFKNTSGGNNVKVNQLSGIDTAGSITVQGEGTATTNMQQGLAKAWVMNENTSTTFTTHDSFNISGQTDEANGQTTFAINNDMGNANYSIVTGGGASSSQRDRTVVVRYDVTATGSYRLDAYDQSSGSAVGMNSLNSAIFGDLA